MSEETWYIPAITVQLADGSTLIKPGKAILRATATVTSRRTGVKRPTLTALADCGLIRRQHPSPGQTFYFPGEVEALLAKTESDPKFWDAVKTKAFLKGRSLSKSNPV